jgi:mRNA interferase MazF
MGAFAKGQIALLTFPFSDLSNSKLRPAVLLAHAGRQDWIVCQITSNPVIDARSISLSGADFSQGGLQRSSYARPGKIFTAHESLIVAAIEMLKQETF